jgi:hypothetical protein
MRESLRRLRYAAIVFSLALLVPVHALAESDCTDGIDNDGDLLIDCLDDSCDGLACDDGVSCTLGEVCDFATTSCTGGTPTDAVCDNGAFCDGIEVCHPLLDCLAGTPPSTDDGVACTDDSCDEVGDTVVNTPNDANCDNGLFCDGAETCDAVLDCQAGTPPAVDDGISCTDDSCDEVGDTVVNTPNDANCDNGLFCDGGETCDALLDCQAGTDPCDDSVACTDDSCDDVLDSCANSANDANCDNGLFCDGNETCDAVLDCQAGTPPASDDGVSCTDDSCDEVGDAIVNTPNDGLCDNGQFCDGAETCDALLDCQAGTPPAVDDGVACTDDSCDEVGDVVVNAPNDANCDNGQFCDGVDTCDALLGCQAGTPPAVDDGISCTDDSCDEVNDVVVNAPNDANCDDGLFCDGAETCDAALDCQAGTDPCNDGVACTDDSCDDVLDSCANAPNDANCDNGLFCDGAETCDAVLDCQAAVNSCDDGVPCTDDSCDDILDTCVNAPNDANCDNGAFCDGSETCDALLGCQAGTPPVADDGVGCTDDSCDEIGDTIVSTPNDANCDNGAFCDGTETCDAVLDCQAGTPPSCDDGVGCTVDTCNVFANGCINLPNNALCSNGQACDGAEVCDPVLDCQGGSAVDCSGLDSDCASASCDPGTGACIVTPINEGLGCDDGDVCTPADVCVAGTCVPGGTLCGDGLVQAECGEDCDPPSTQACDNLSDGDGDGLVGCLDPDCCSAVAPTCGSDCTTSSFCKPILDDPAVVRFTDGTFSRALFKFHGRVAANPLFVKPLEEGFSVALSNSSGEIYRGELLPGDLIERGAARYLFKDKTAKAGPGVRDGLALIRLVFRRQNEGQWFVHVKVKAWSDDFAAATESLMSTQITGVGDIGLLSANWVQTRRGWKLPYGQLANLTTPFSCTQN